MALVHFIQILLFGTLPLIANCTDAPQMVILVTDSGSKDIYKINIHHWNMTSLSIPHLIWPEAIDYDKRDKYIYWTDTFNKQVRRASIDGGNDQAVKMLNSTSIPAGLTLDSSTRQVFYTDEGNDIIVRIEMDTFTSTVIVNTGLDEPRGIVADTKNRRLYWVEIGGNQTIKGCDYNGAQQRTLVSTGLLYPYGITIDEVAGRLFWSEGSGYIESVLVSGLGRTIIHKSPGKVYIDISFFNGFLYYTSVNDTGIWVMSQDGENIFKIPTSSLDRPWGIHVFSPNVDLPVTCPRGQYGVNCVSCGKCAGGRICERTTGTCFTICQSGYQDNQCQKECDSGTYGSRCRSACSDQCRKGTVCHHVTGQCPDGCKPGWKGNNCSVADSTPEATSTDGKMTESGLSSGVIAGIAVGVAVLVLVIVVAVIVVVVVRKRKRSPSRLTEENGGMSRQPGNVNPGFSNNEYNERNSMHDIISNVTTFKNAKN